MNVPGLIHKYYERRLCSTDYPSDFHQALSVLIKLESNLIQRSAEYPREGIPIERQTREITIHNIHHPLHHIDSYWWVLNADIDDWWPTIEEINTLQKWGWFICQ